MFLYHGTFLKNLKPVLQNGILPRGTRNGNYKGLYQSQSDKVYLSDAYALSFAMLTPAKALSNKFLMFEVDMDRLDREKFYPDEDYLAQRYTAGKGEPLAKSHALVSKHKEVLKQHWEESLAELGNVAYQGVVPVSAITRYVVFRWKDHPEIAHLACRGKVYLDDYELHAATYRSIYAWLFGHRSDIVVKTMSESDRHVWGERTKCRKGVELVPVNP
jgi:hypothetical protein